MDNHIPYRPNRILPETYHALAASRGFEWIGDYSDTRSKTTWRCSEGHEWQAAYYKIKAGRGCPICATKQRAQKHRLTVDDYHALAISRGFEWIGEYTFARKKTTWRCSKGHEWRAPYYSIKEGTGCPICGHMVGNQKRSGKNRRYSAEDYHKVAAKWGISWLGETPSNSKSLTRWRCSCGHEWDVSYSNIQKGKLCPRCRGKRRVNPKRISPWGYADLGKAHNLIWLGPVVKSTGQLTQWQCAYGHVWQTYYDKIKQGRGCPYCQGMINGARVSQVQLKLGEILEGEVNLKVGDYYLDIALHVNGVKIAVEYDAYYWHRQVRDMTVFEQNRDRYLVRRGWRIIHVRSNTLLPTIEQLDCAIEEILNGQTNVEIILEDWGERTKSGS